MNIEEIITSSDWQFPEDNGVRFVIHREDLTEAQALSEFGLTRARMKKEPLVSEYVWDDGMLHFTFDHSVLESINYQY